MTPRFANLRRGHLMRTARRVTVADLIDIAAFALIAGAVVYATLMIGGTT